MKKIYKVTEHGNTHKEITEPVFCPECYSENTRKKIKYGPYPRGVFVESLSTETSYFCEDCHCEFTEIELEKDYKHLAVFILSFAIFTMSIFICICLSMCEDGTTITLLDILSITMFFVGVVGMLFATFVEF